MQICGSYANLNEQWNIHGYNILKSSLQWDTSLKASLNPCHKKKMQAYLCIFDLDISCDG